MAEQAPDAPAENAADEAMPQDDAAMVLAMGIVDTLDAAMSDGLDPNEVDGATIVLKMADGSTKELPVAVGEEAPADGDAPPAEVAA